MKKKIFITGSEGFIGSHIVEKFISLNYDVYALVLYNSFGNLGNLNFLPKKYLDKIKIIFGDLRDENTYSKILRHVDYVVNLASLISIPYSYSANKSYFDKQQTPYPAVFHTLLHTSKEWISVQVIDSVKVLNHSVNQQVMIF